MKCIVCYLHPYYKNNPLQTEATMVVNGHSVCEQHVPAACKSTSINVVMQRLRSNELFGVANENRTQS